MLATKLHRPSLPATWIQRPRLIQRLNEGLASGRPVTLVSAPAGFGKTTCISEWVQALEGWAFAWLSLDPADDDPGRFFAYFIAALQQVAPELGQEISGVLRAGQLPPSEIISAALGNDILALESPFLLVLDDFQVIQDRFILDVLETLIANPPPPLHLVLLTREDPPLPLARLRASNQLTEIRARDLRFSSQDASRFLNDAMGLSLSPADIAALEDKTEGWIVGLHLAAIAIKPLHARPPGQERADPSAFIATLSGSHRFILGYLTEQVLDQQPEAIRHFLLQTALLDKLNGDLCDAVTGRSDSRMLLERLFNANLFLIPLDDAGQWYRYHHLFADLLRDLQSTLQKDKLAELHQRASRWYAQVGMASEAIQHALAAEDYALAVDLLEQHAQRMIMQGYAKTVHNWVEAIPAKWASQSPRTNLAFAWMHLLRGSYAQAASYLARSQAALAAPHRGEELASLKAEWLVMQSLRLYGEAKPVKSMATAMQALDIAPEQDSRVRGLAYWGLASAYDLMGEYPRAVEAYQMAMKHGRAAENLVAEMMGTVGLAVMAFEHGQLHLAFEIATPVITRIEQSGSLPPISAVIYGALAEVYYQWYQVEQARHYALRALQLATLGGYNSGVIFCRVLLSRLAHLEGNLESAAREIQKAVELVGLQAPDNVRREVISQQVRVYLARERPAAAQLALEGQGFSFQDVFSFPDLPSDQGIPYALGLLYNSSLHVLLYQAQAERDVTGLQPGSALAERLIAGALPSQSLLIALEALLLRAQLHAAMGEHPASQADYIKALELGEPEGIIGLFVEQGPPVAEALATLLKRDQVGAVRPDYVVRILAAFSGPQPSPSDRQSETETAALVEPLTERELEVLRLIAEGLTYKEIAARLFISLNTVRTHIKAIYGKLNVNNRTKAVEMARQLQIL